MRCGARVLCKGLGSVVAAQAAQPVRRRPRSTQKMNLGNGITITVNVPRSTNASKAVALFHESTNEDALWDSTCTSSGYLAALQNTEQHLTCRAMLQDWAELQVASKKIQDETRLQEMETTWRALRDEALPLLFSLAERITSSHVAIPHAQLVHSQRCVVDALALVEKMTRTTGRRYERAFPAWLVAALWRTAMPSIHQLSVKEKGKKQRRRTSKANGSSMPEQNVSEGSTSAMVQCAERDAVSSSVTQSSATREELKEAFRATRRALALRTVAIADVMPVDILADVLLHMQDCGAMSDDILSPILTDLMHRCETLRGEGKDAISPYSPNQLVHWRVTQRLDKTQLPCSPAGALVLLRVLGRQSLPYHSGAHRLVHSLLLPAIEDTFSSLVTQQQQNNSTSDSSSMLSRQVLSELTTCFVRYAVSGPVVSNLITLWLSYLQPSTTTTNATGLLSLKECTTLLQILVGGSTSKGTLMPSPTRRPRYQAVHAAHAVKPEALRAVAVEEYQPLVEALCARLAHLCHDITIKQDSGKSVRREEGIAWAKLLCVLCRVDSVAWFDLYNMVATSVLVHITPQALVPNAKEQQHAAPSLLSKRLSFPVSMAVDVLRAVLYRNTLVPHHALHSVLLRHVLHSSEALKDSRTAGVALIAMAVISGISVLTGQSSNVNIMSSYTTEDRAVALRLFRRHGRRLPLSAFAAALCVVPLGELPVKSQRLVVQYFTQIAVALSPRWLVRGMAGLTQQLPSAVDEVSLQRWLSRFTARDVLARIDMTSCVALLHMFTLHASAGTNSALAKQSIVRRVVRLLRQNDPETRIAVLAALPHLVTALRATDTFFAFIFARLSRLLLSEVERGTWTELLPGFAAMADEYTQRSLGERHGGVFRDVWEMLRGRVMQDAGASLAQSTSEVTMKSSTTFSSAWSKDVWAAMPLVMAYNGFAQLDVTDRALFAVLTHQLISVLQVQAHKPSTNTTGEADGATIDVTQDTIVNDSSGEDDDVAVAPLLAALCPSAVAVLTTSLIYAMPEHIAGDDERRHTKVQLRLLTASLVQLQACSSELYPMDVLHVMPYLLRVFAELSALEPAQDTHDGKDMQSDAVQEEQSVWAMWGRVAMHQTVLHRAYDACRELFLLMFIPQPTEKAITTTTSSTDATDTYSITATTAEDNSSLAVPASDAIVEQRKDWSPRVWSSVRLVPKYLFAELLTSLCNASLADDAVVHACALQLTREARTCEKVLTAGQLVDVCMALCFCLSARRQTTTSSKTSEDEPRPLQSYLAVVLTALWQRSDELTVKQIDALLRCLRDCFADKVDTDFVERLQSQRQLLMQPRSQKQEEEEKPQAQEVSEVAKETSASEPVQDESAAAEALDALMSD